ncbi:DUF3291 domain-containing protein [Paraferrimonas sedimenticola]|uniref:DUF3291 domain-containing protein n=1 Tax=Paraferrimonas sedimenticola TaxID=375674 RepID=A0AA37RVQ4_9GAMM|nr:DUF3291 domain-containing protein [Paraferrimonas sedimenticola]GLP96184.1 hypothetical protein GCM10007895_14900 [Paraferrimonas sedimenticola]
MHLAQVNIAKAKYELDDPKIAEFVGNLDKVNSIAEASEGFVWRLKLETDQIVDFSLFDDSNYIINISVWESADALKNFMFNGLHKEFLGRKKEWFEALPQASYALWWVEEGEQPTVEQALERLMHLRKKGESDFAFTLRR